MMSVRSKNLATCPSCGSEDVVSISMSLDDVAVEFRNCHRCEHRWWEQDGVPVPRDAVVSRIPRR